VADEKTEYRIAFANIINIDTGNILRARVIGALSQNDFGSLTILFSSEGGSTDQSVSLYNFLRQLPVPVHMHAMGHIGSAALPLFLAADKRTAAKEARFFLHEYDWGFTERAKLHRIDEAAGRLRHDIKLAKDIIQARAPKIPPKLTKAISGDAPPPSLRRIKQNSSKLSAPWVTLSPPGELPSGSPEPLPNRMFDNSASPRGATGQTEALSALASPF
jgi:ATP-dependent protease ClpP protease subunit